ncbi:MAG: TSUP family transporter [Sciscionella sp.]
MTALTFLLLATTVTIAAFVQGSSGLGFALIAAPVIGIVQASLLPVAVLMLMIPLNCYIAWRERGNIDRHGAGWVTAGRLAGTAGGLAVLAVVPPQHLNLLIGVAIVLAALVSLAAPSFTPGRCALLAAGTVTGVTETATGVGGPPLALVYQHHPAPVLRSTIAVCFLIGEIASLALLVLTGTTHLGQLRTAALLLPALALGAFLSRFVHHRLNGPKMRVGVLSFALISGVALLINL